MNYIREFQESERLQQWLRMRSRVGKNHYSAKFNSGLVAVDKKGRVKKKGELKTEKENEDPDR